jgi:hypothetical protein
MDKTALVNIEIERASEILDILDHADMRVSVALWAYLSEYEDWRLVLSSRQLDALGESSARMRINAALAAAKFGLEKKPPLVILSMSAPFIKALRKRYSKYETVEGIRLGLQTFGDRFLEDGYAFRIQ